jgi:hypothetical protein
MPPRKGLPPSTDAAGVERLLHILGYGHLRARSVGRNIIVESGTPSDPHPRLRLCPLPRKEWRVDVRTPGDRWEKTPIIGPRGNVIAAVHQELTWLLAPIPGG